MSRPRHSWTTESGVAARRSSGQVLAIMGIGMVVMLLFAGLVIDGGNAFAQQRAVQNGSDAASEAGAIILAERLAGQPVPAGGWDAAVEARILELADTNDIVVEAAYYTDICGIPLRSNGQPALDLATGRYDLAVAAPVGGGIPTSSATMPDCPNRVVGPPAGVLVIGNREVDTYLARLAGVNTLRPTAQATSVAGWLTGFCDADQGEYCALFPITIPVNITTCDGRNRPVNTGIPWDKYTVYKIPLCQNSPGSVGWIDWDPPAGGIPDVIDSIDTPDNPDIDLPSWQFVTETGDTNSAPLEDALNAHAGEVVLLPMFDLTCNPGPGDEPDSTKPAVETAPNYGCPPGDLGAAGANQWYRFPSFAALELCDPSYGYCGGLTGVYMSGNDADVCDTGNGATSCLVGQFVDFISTGTVSAGGGGSSGFSKIVGVQLIK